MKAKIFRSSFAVALVALLAAGILFLSVMYTNDGALAFEKLEAETAALAPGTEDGGAAYLKRAAGDDRITRVAAD